jgi:arylsulfatase A-like enzyme
VRRLLALLALAFFSLGACAAEHGRAKHVVLIVWDGMRPDFVTEQYTPNLWNLAQKGVTFRNHHSFYPCMTNVNGTVFATGVFPSRSGLIANTEFRPALNASATLDMAVAENVRKSDEVTGGHHLTAPTLPEMLHNAGRRTAVAGTKWIAGLFDRARTRPNDAAKASPVATDGSVSGAADDSLGAYPKKAQPNEGQDKWTTAALTQTFWSANVPDLSVLWLSEPDFTAHDAAPGAPPVLEAIESSDARLGEVLAALEAKHVRGKTDVLVVSDHGFSTIERANDLPALLQNAGFNAVKKFEGEADAGSILIAGNAGTALFYVTEHDAAVTRRLVEWLQQTDFAGVIFTREKMEGTFLIDQIHMAKEGGPDVIMAFRWNDKPNQFGAPGMIMADWNRAAGQGTHATVSKFDVHNILFAAGPDFRRAYVSEVPSGNIDVAPTILRILGVTSSSPLDGRVLSEAMTLGDRHKPEVRHKREKATRLFGSSRWQQYLEISRVGQQSYIDEGNGSFGDETTR